MNETRQLEIEPLPAPAPDKQRAKSFAESLTAVERRLRWFIIGWLTLSTILNLISRNTLAILAPVLKEKFDLTQADYGNIIMAFQFSYAVMYVAGGRFVDRVGEKIGMAFCIGWWSVCTMLHALARGVWSLGLVRFLLGVGEPGNYPAALRASARWFAREERGLPIAIWSAGSSVGSLLSVPMIAFLALHFGWQTAFVVPGLLGVIWLVVWLLAYRLPSVAVNAAGWAAKTSSAETSKSETFFDLLRDRKVWGLTLARLLTDPIWVFYLAWTPKYLAEVWKFDLRQMAYFGWIPFLFGGLGGVLGGVASDRLIRGGWAPPRARKFCLYVTGALAPLGMLTGLVGTPGAALALVAMMAFICYVWFINTAALMSDVFPENVVGTVLGLGAGAGQFGGIAMAGLAGYLLEHSSNARYGYMTLFFVAGSAYVLASLILFFLLKEKSPK